ncbi:sensor histidine kinase [Paraglaciecola sp.]|uniref:sensor histidine kinase n=1 Tax=Paraglaciecola sp. TaxID=1920173 RepID=UPI003EF59387
MIKRLLFLVILLSYVSQSIASGSWTVNTVHPLYFDKDQKNDHIYKVTFDKTGFLWLATDAGLKRYDGYKTRDFIYDDKDPSSIGSNSINSLLIDQQEVLWVGGENLNRYDPNTETFDRFEVSNGAAIWALYKSSKNIIWVGGEGFGLRGYDVNKKEFVFKGLNSGPSRFVNAIIPAFNSDKMWVGSNGGIYLFDPESKQYEMYFSPDSLLLDNFLMRDMAMDGEGNLWVVSEDGLVVLNPKNKIVKHYTHDPKDPNSLKTTTLWSVHKDEQGRMWIGTDKQGVHIYNPIKDNFTHIPASPNNNDTLAFPPTSINNIYQDQQGSMWFASPHYGLRRISSQLEKFIILKEIAGGSNSLGFNNVLDIHQAQNGIIWIATDGGGLDRFDPNTGLFKNYKNDSENPNSLSSDSVIVIDEDELGNLWLGTYNGGVNIFDPSTGEFEHLLHNKQQAQNQTIGNNNVFDIHYASTGKVFISVWRKGLQVYDPKTKLFESYFAGVQDDETGISNYSINNITPDGRGKYWIGGHAGLELFDPSSKTFSDVSLPSVDAIYDILLDEVDKSVLWLATPNGVVKYNHDTGTQVAFTAEQGLSDNFVVSLERDNNGNIWIGTRSGLNRLDAETLIFTQFTLAEGLSSNQFNRLSHLFSKDGKMYFGGSAGINVFNPDNMPRNEHLPNVVITEFELNQKPLKIGPAEVLKQHISLTKELFLEYSQNNMTFEFTALNFVSPNQNRFKYRLLGFEGQWKYVDSSERRVRYTNLDPGEYIFEVSASNNEGLWNPKTTSITIKITPPWWNTWWSNILAVLLLLYFVWLYIQAQNNSAINRANNLELKVSERTEELHQSNQELENAIIKLESAQDKLVEAKKMAALGVMVSGVAHEVNTPLGVCVTAVSHVQNIAVDLFNKFDKKVLKNSDFERFRKDVTTGTDLISTNLNRAAELVKSFKKVAVEQSSETASTFLFDEFMCDVVKATAPNLKNKPIELHVNCTPNMELRSYPGVISQILIGFIMNSLTHAFEKEQVGNIWIEVENDKSDKVRICYKDDGKGINPKDIDQVFEPFFTTSRHQGNAGLGLNIIYNLVTQKLKGEILVNKPEIGVEFVLTFSRRMS